MITSAATYAQHASAWGHDAGYAALPDLAAQVRSAIEAGDRDPAHVINLAAILLDLHRNAEALAWLIAHPLEYREYYQNLATAFAKTDPDNLEAIRSNNRNARDAPPCPNAILAYIDYQGL